MSPRLAAFPHDNPIYLTLGPGRGHQAAPFAVVVLALSGWLAFLRRPGLAAALVWQAVVLARTPQTQGWHSILLLPLLLAMDPIWLLTRILTADA